MEIPAKKPKAPIGLALGLGGMSGALYAVAWMRSLALIFGPSAYSRAVVTASIMAGLALGCYLGGAAGARFRSPLHLVALMFLGAGVFGAVSLAALEIIPGLYFHVHQNYRLRLEVFFAGQFLLSSLAVLPSSAFLGAAIPLAGKAGTSDGAEAWESVGAFLSCILIGSALGAVIGGFLLIPLAGIKWTALAAGATCVLAGFAVVLRAGKGVAIYGLVSALAFGGPSAAAKNGGPPAFSFDRHGRHGSLKDSIEEIRSLKPLYRMEDPEGAVSVFFDHRAMSAVLNHKGAGLGSSRELNPTAGALAALSLAYRPQGDAALLLGIGSGQTANALRRAGIMVDCLELNSSLMGAVGTHFYPGLFSGGGRHYREGPGNFLKRDGRKYSLIAAPPSASLFDPDAASRTTLEFLRLVKLRLAPAGLFAQSFPYPLLGDEDVSTTIRTFAKVFNHVAVWKVRGPEDLILAGSDGRLDDSPESVRSRAESYLEGTGPISMTLSRTPEQARQIALEGGGRVVHVDDRPALEYAAARMAAMGGRDR